MLHLKHHTAFSNSFHGAEDVGRAGPSRRGLLAAACACCAVGVLGPVRATANVPAAPTRALHGMLDRAAAEIEARMIAWRRDIHQNPELGNKEVRTAALVAAHL